MSRDYIYTKAYKKYEEDILKDRDKLRNGVKFSQLKNKNVLFIDDSSESSLRALVAIKSALKMEAKTITYLCAVIPKELEKILEKNIDNLFYLYSAYNYVDNQHYYIEKLKMFDDEEVEKILKNSKNYIINDKDE